MNQVNDPELLLGDIVDYLDQAEAMLKSKEIHSLAGLDGMVETLCKNILKLSAEQSQEYKPELEHLVERLTALQKQMTDARDAVAESINALGNRQRASKAYLSAPENKN